MTYSQRCPDRTTHWDHQHRLCVRCPFAPGKEITPNCGYDDDGGRHEVPLKSCKSNTFNQGWEPYCQPCSQCQPGHRLLSPCNSTTDTRCALVQNRPMTSGNSATVLWAVPFAITVAILLGVVAFIYMRSRNAASNSSTGVAYTRDSSHRHKDFQSAGPSGSTEPSDLLSPQILSAPLQTVLDELDVLEDLVILLDPDHGGVKNTKHLASLCSFSSSWITYTYSMKDSRSPLKAVLEGVACKHPDWTVGHLAKMFQAIERHDAVVVLRKLDTNKLLDV